MLSIASHLTFGLPFPITLTSDMTGISFPCTPPYQIHHQEYGWQEPFVHLLTNRYELGNKVMALAAVFGSGLYCSIRLSLYNLALLFFFMSVWCASVRQAQFT